jgi:hypothetical protein
MASNATISFFMRAPSIRTVCSLSPGLHLAAGWRPGLHTQVHGGLLDDWPFHDAAMISTMPESCQPRTTVDGR